MTCSCFNLPTVTTKEEQTIDDAAGVVGCILSLFKMCTIGISPLTFPPNNAAIDLPTHSARSSGRSIASELNAGTWSDRPELDFCRVFTCHVCSDLQSRFVRFRLAFRASIVMYGGRLTVFQMSVIINYVIVSRCDASDIFSRNCVHFPNIVHEVLNVFTTSCTFFSTCVAYLFSTFVVLYFIYIWQQSHIIIARRKCNDSII